MYFWISSLIPIFIVLFEVLAILFNCSEPEAISEALSKISSDQDLVSELRSNKIVLGAYAHKLTQIDTDWTLKESEAPQPFRKDLNEEIYWKDFVKIWINKFGVKVVGGCCGITPEHIHYIRVNIDNMGQ